LLTLILNKTSGPGELFKKNLSPADIIENLSLYYGKKIGSQDTLIFFDEIQVVPEVLTSLKYFHEEAPEYHIIAAGSLLGASVAKENSFPVIGIYLFGKLLPDRLTIFDNLRSKCPWLDPCFSTLLRKSCNKKQVSKDSEEMREVFICKNRSTSKVLTCSLSALNYGYNQDLRQGNKKGQAWQYPYEHR